MAYLYELFIKQQQGLLESAQAEMPPNSQHSSDGNHEGVRPRPDSKEGPAWKKGLVAALSRPVKVAKTADEKRDDYELAKLNAVRRKREERALQRELELELEELEEKISEREQGHTAVPPLWKMKKQKLELQLQELYKVEEEQTFQDDDDGTEENRGGNSRPKATTKGKATSKKAPHRSRASDEMEDQDEWDEEFDDDGMLRDGNGHVIRSSDEEDEDDDDDEENED